METKTETRWLIPVAASHCMEENSSAVVLGVAPRLAVRPDSLATVPFLVRVQYERVLTFSKTTVEDWLAAHDKHVRITKRGSYRNPDSEVSYDGYLVDVMGETEDGNMIPHLVLRGVRVRRWEEHGHSDSWNDFLEISLACDRWTETEVHFVT